MKSDIFYQWNSFRQRVRCLSVCLWPSIDFFFLATDPMDDDELLWINTANHHQALWRPTFFKRLANWFDYKSFDHAPYARVCAILKTVTNQSTGKDCWWSSWPMEMAGDSILGPSVQNLDISFVYRGHSPPKEIQVHGIFLSPQWQATFHPLTNQQHNYYRAIFF